MLGGLYYKNHINNNNFHLPIMVIIRKFVRYAPHKKADPINGGRPVEFTWDTPNFSPSLTVFCGIRFMHCIIQSYDMI